ncbi:16S rRNA (cytidine1402-2'-O)-methyltransferase [Desulfonispora thiosulfatigenes DSM 11270]|uniref:Ribosomal RNA small subunit methyltransferase I n=1 Tax=Desulfonispora thiosulfatigenes DSM 11270 TaxID=656914 RepID=A0A1W1V0Q2_DESTI|nr:16S rRNA (cytidine(1402)-2'-O)-methyltransferase [Desulfonispora thiosulfatigenes]SMB86925.1 16S rRNA (cytidine1402-2'-O)-methyltransferase [Desulfonispora thiosulfatigenes DSM 11270]
MLERGRLFLCATPIGNLQDITLRVLETLKTVDLIACEDTRQTRKLLNHFEINTSLTSYYEHNKDFKGEILIKELLEGKNIALVSDAGMPGIQDPGHDLVKDCIRENIEVTVLPGAVAAITGLVVSGLSSERFCFEGFVPRDKKAKREIFSNLLLEERTIIFYEAPHRILNTLQIMLEVFKDRQIVACRELTKKYEEVFRGTIQEVWNHFNEKEIKGEFTLIIEGAKIIKVEKGLDWAIEKAQELIMEGISPKEAVKQVAKEADIKKRDLYEVIMVKK